ncbi:MAG: acyltransferase family protein [Desulfovibrionaceae bacterium]
MDNDHTAPPPDLNARRRTAVSVLRGLAILAVVANHYANDYISGPWRDYANGFIGLFFIVSGYLAWYSMAGVAGFTGTRAAAYYFAKKFLRLYPAFLATLAVGLLLFHESYPWNILILKRPAPWFINAIAQCYLFTYVFALPVRRLRFWQALAAVTVIFLCAALAIHLVDGMNRRPYAFRGLPAAHIWLFGLGMLTARWKDELAQPLGNTPARAMGRILDTPLWLCSALYLGGVYLTRSVHHLPQGAAMFSGVLFVLFTALLFARVMRGGCGSRGLAWLVASGNASYAIYLLSPYYFRTLRELDLLHKDSLLSICFVVCCFPIFHLLASRLERWANLAASPLLGLAARVLRLGAARG